MTTAGRNRHDSRGGSGAGRSRRSQPAASRAHDDGSIVESGRLLSESRPGGVTSADRRETVRERLTERCSSRRHRAGIERRRSAAAKEVSHTLSRPPAATGRHCRHCRPPPPPSRWRVKDVKYARQGSRPPFRSGRHESVLRVLGRTRHGVHFVDTRQAACARSNSAA